MRKRIIAILLSMGMAILICGCGDSSKGRSTGGGGGGGMGEMPAGSIWNRSKTEADTEEATDAPTTEKPTEAKTEEPSEDTSEETPASQEDTPSTEAPKQDIDYQMAGEWVLETVESTVPTRNRKLVLYEGGGCINVDEIGVWEATDNSITIRGIRDNMFWNHDNIEGTLKLEGDSMTITNVRLDGNEKEGCLVYVRKVPNPYHAFDAKCVQEQQLIGHWVYDSKESSESVHAKELTLSEYGKCINSGEDGIWSISDHTLWIRPEKSDLFWETDTIIGLVSIDGNTMVIDYVCIDGKQVNGRLVYNKE